MKLISRIAAFVVLTLALAGSASAAECQLRNLSFVSVTNAGEMRINSEIWNPSTGAFLGNIANTTFCNVNTTLNGVTAQSCRNWYQVALTAMITERKIYLTASNPSCPVGNPVTFTGLGYFGLNN
jgi:hypothetical protein